MNLLFITSTRLGDAVLSTGALDYFIKKYPGIEVTVVCGPLVEGLFEQAPGVKKVIPLKKEPLGAHWAKLWRDVAYSPWDIVIDLRNSLISRLIPAKKRYIWGRQNKALHKVEQIATVVHAVPPPAPTLWLNGETREAAAALVPKAGNILGIGPAANWQGKIWPAESFIELIRRLTAPGAILEDSPVAVFAAPGEEEIAYSVLNSVPPERRLDVIAKTSPIIAAAALQNCSLFIGNDSGLMHCAAAVKTPTLGLFGPSWPHLYRPWGEHCAYVSTPENFDELTSYKGYDPRTAPCLMTSLTVDAVYDAAVSLWKKSA